MSIIKDNSYGFLNFVLKNYVIICPDFVMYNFIRAGYYITRSEANYTCNRTSVAYSGL